MVLLDELRVTMSDYRKDLKELYEVLGIEKAQARYDALQKQVADPDFYSDLENSQKVLQEVKSLENRIEKYQKMEETLDDILTLIELTMEEGEEESNAELNEEADKFVKELESLKLASLLTGEYDSSNAILTFHAGAGGTEAQDWAEMLYRMYNRWAERHNFKAELLDYLDGDEAGLKSASIMISGDNAYGFLKSESGVHRLVRVSPFDSSGRRHTSFAALEVMPEIDDSMEVDIRPEDIKMDVFRASGAGGQHINKTSSASDTPAHRHRGILPDTAKPVPEQGLRDEDAPCKTGGDQGTGTSGQDRRHQGRAEGNRMGCPDPFLRVHAVYIGKGSPHRLRKRQHSGSHGRRSGRLHQRLSESIVQRHIAEVRFCKL